MTENNKEAFETILFEETDCLCGNNKEKGWLNKVGGDMICEDCDIGGCNQMITEEDFECEEEDPCETCIVCLEKYDYKNTGRMCLVHDPRDLRGEE